MGIIEDKILDGKDLEQAYHEGLITSGEWLHESLKVLRRNYEIATGLPWENKENHDS